MKRLIVGAGMHKRFADSIHLDMYPFHGIDVVHDLTVTPWPFEENQFDHVLAEHVVEHLPSLVNFMNAAWRVIAKNGILRIETPNAGVNPDLEYGDPTHVRCYRHCTFINYFTLKGKSFGYTERFWEVVLIKTFATEVSGDTLLVELTPLK